jgi:hypothetical protein
LAKKIDERVKVQVARLSVPGVAAVKIQNLLPEFMDGNGRGDEPFSFIVLQGRLEIVPKIRVELIQGKGANPRAIRAKGYAG